jgi:hypothetical protein
VKVRQVAGSAHLYELTFGAGLDPAAAEVFKRMADASRLTPSHKVADNFFINEPAEIHLEPK